MPLVKLKRGYTYRMPAMGDSPDTVYGSLKTYDDPPFEVPQSTYDSHSDIMDLIGAAPKAPKKGPAGPSPEELAQKDLDDAMAEARAAGVTDEQMAG
jgi:hypothetical protein